MARGIIAIAAVVIAAACGGMEKYEKDSTTTDTAVDSAGDTGTDTAGDTAGGLRESFDTLFKGNPASVYRSMYRLLETKCRNAGVKLGHF